jgi:chemotaxis protein histidine kinase CheA
VPVFPGKELRVSLRGRLHTVAPAAKILEFLMVVCGQTHFALQADMVRSIIRPDEGDAESMLSAFGVTTSPPHLSEHFGLTGSYLSPESRILVCGLQSTHVAFHVDRVMGLHDTDSTKIKPLLPHFMGPERRWIGGMFLFRQTVALVLNIDWLLSGDRRGRAVSSQVGEPMDQGLAPEACLNTVIDMMAIRRERPDWNVMNFEEATDADDTPWAQI